MERDSSIPRLGRGARARGRRGVKTYGGKDRPRAAWGRGHWARSGLEASVFCALRHWAQLSEVGTPSHPQGGGRRAVLGGMALSSRSYTLTLENLWQTSRACVFARVVACRPVPFPYVLRCRAFASSVAFLVARRRGYRMPMHGARAITYLSTSSVGGGVPFTPPSVH